jgi:hypothetical protein
MDVLKRDTSESGGVDKKRQNLFVQTDGSGDAKSQRELMRQRRQEMRRQKLEQKYLKRASQVVETFERLMKVLTDEIVESGRDAPTEEVAIVFGATPVI